MKNLLAFIGAVLLSTAGFTQATTGTIKGKVFDGETGEPVFSARVWVESPSGPIITKTDMDGVYRLEALKPGVYNFYCKPVGKDTVNFTEVQVNPDQITTLKDIKTTSGLLGVVIVKYEPPLITKEIHRIDITTKDIEHSINIRDPKAMISSMSSEISVPEGTSDVIIRGSRPNDVIYYVDGVKSTDMASVPGASVRSMSAYTGGVPAKYGDTTGGVIALETKSYFDLYYAWKARQQ